MEAPAVPGSTRILSRTAGWLALAYCLAVTGLQLWDVIREGDAELFLLSLIFIPWLVAPIILAATLAGASPTRLGAAVFLALEAGLILSVILIVVDFIYIHPSSMGGVALLIWPVFQLAATVALVLLASLFGWRMRPDFLKDDPPAAPPPRA